MVSEYFEDSGKFVEVFDMVPFISSTALFQTSMSVLGLKGTSQNFSSGKPHSSRLKYKSNEIDACCKVNALYYYSIGVQRTKSRQILPDCDFLPCQHRSRIWSSCKQIFSSFSPLLHLHVNTSVFV